MNATGLGGDIIDWWEGTAPGNAGGPALGKNGSAFKMGRNRQVVGDPEARTTAELVLLRRHGHAHADGGCGLVGQAYTDKQVTDQVVRIIDQHPADTPLFYYVVSSCRPQASQASEQALRT